MGVSTCIVNVAVGAYLPSQERLAQSLKDVGYEGATMFWTGEFPAGCPGHLEVPYAFKTFALTEAKKAGHEIALWVDSSLYAVQNPQPVFSWIEEHGHLFELAGHWLGTWCTDAFLEKNEITRDEAMVIPMYSAGFTGLDLRLPRSREFLRQWHKMAVDGVSFIGPWQGKSNDPRYQGHRHDMSAASLLAYRLGMKLTDPRFMVYADYTPNPSAGAVFLCKGIA